MDKIAWIGLDAHRDTITAATLVGNEDACINTREFANSEKSVRRYFDGIVKVLRKQYPGDDDAAWEIRCCYEASGGGYVLYRQLAGLEIPNVTLTCQVVAPSKIPRRAGDRVKNDRRDARGLARWLRAGELVCVRVPSAEEEGVRSLVRQHETLGRGTTRAKNHVLKLLTARGYVYREGKNWTRGHWTWLRALSLETHDQSALNRYLSLLEFTLAQREELAREIEQITTTDRYRVAVGALRCLFGIESMQAMTLLVETCDFRRFPSARRYASYLGLPPGEYSSGGKTRHGGMSKTGNAHCRQVVVSAARLYSRPPRPNGEWTRRHGDQPPHVVEHAWKCRRRLHQRYWHLVHRKGAGASNKAVVAIARELSGFVWALMVEIEETLERDAMPAVA